MKAVFLLPSDPYVPRPVLRALREADALRDAGWDVAFVSWIRGEALPGTTADPFPVRRISIPMPALGTSFLARWRAYDRVTAALRDAIDDERPDLVVAHDFEVLRAATSVRRRSSVRLFYDSHEDYPSLARRNSLLEGWIAARLERRLCRFADHVFTVSQPIADKFISWGRPTTVLYNARPSSEIGFAERETSRRTLGYGPDDFVIGFAGALERDRGIDVIVRALTRLPEPVKALIVGGPDPAVSRLRSLADGLGLDGRVRVDRQRPYSELEPYYAAMDVGAMLLEKQPGARDVDLQIAGNLPNKVFDYMARGIPVLVADYTAAGSLVRTAGAGTALREVNAPTVSAVLAGLLDRRDALPAMALNGRIAFEQTYAWEHQAKKFLHVVSGKSPAG